MTAFVWSIDAENYLWDKNKRPYEDSASLRSFISQVCKQLDFYAKNYTLEQLQNGDVAHCHRHKQEIANVKSPEYQRLFDRLRDINKMLGERKNAVPTQIEPKDILQLAFPNIEDRFRAFGYVLDNVFYLIYFDRYHKVYKM